MIMPRQNQQTHSSSSKTSRSTRGQQQSHRGFAGMSSSKQRQIARMGGLASHEGRGRTPQQTPSRRTRSISSNEDVGAGSRYASSNRRNGEDHWGSSRSNESRDRGRKGFASMEGDRHSHDNPRSSGYESRRQNEGERGYGGFGRRDREEREDRDQNGNRRSRFAQSGAEEDFDEESPEYRMSDYNEDDENEEDDQNEMRSRDRDYEEEDSDDDRDSRYSH